MSGVWAWVNSNRRSVFAVILWFIILGSVWVWSQANGLTIGGLMDGLASLLRDTPYGLSIYFIAFFLRPLTLVPSWTFLVLGGALWGQWPGILYATIGAMLSGILFYHIGRAFRRNPPVAPAATNVFQRLMHTAHENPFQAVLLTRMLQLPYDFTNLALGGMGIPATAYYSATVVGNIFGSLPYILVGASFEGDFATGEFSVDVGTLMLSILTMLLSFAVSWWLRRRALARRDNLTKQGESDTEHLR